MPSLGAFTWFDRALPKIADPINLVSDSFKIVLCTAAQPFTKIFAGASTDCRYSDLAAELPTANGYTLGGITLSGVALTRLLSVVKWTADPVSWTFGANIPLKWIVIYSNTATNKDLLCFCNIDTTTALDTLALAGTFGITPNAAGILTWSQP